MVNVLFVAVVLNAAVVYKTESFEIHKYVQLVHVQ
jgi:hypothetical protein